jgi:hypothetical protein
MFNYYNVFLVDGNGNHIKHIDMVAALSESSAIDKAFNLYGSPSKYSGWGRDNFVAERA